MSSIQASGSTLSFEAIMAIIVVCITATAAIVSLCACRYLRDDPARDSIRDEPTVYYD